MQFLGYAKGFHIRLSAPPTCPLHPINPSNACHLRITAAAGTELAVASSAGTVKQLHLLDKVTFLPTDSALQSEDLHRTRGVALSPFRALQKILDCSLP